MTFSTCKLCPGRRIRHFPTLNMKATQNGKGDAEEEMDHDGAESEKSSAEEESHTCSTEEDQEDESHSDMDEAECERRRHDFLADMSELEKQFCELKEQLCRERLQQIEVKIGEIQANKANEYLQPLMQLEEQMKMKKRVASVRKEMALDSIKQKFESEELAAFQHMESDKVLLYDTIKQELEDKIRRLEEDRHNTDITSDLWQESQTMKKKKKADPYHSDRRKKPQAVSGPYIVYMLRDTDVMDDWMAIKKFKDCYKLLLMCSEMYSCLEQALKQQTQRRKAEL